MKEKDSLLYRLGQVGKTLFDDTPTPDPLEPGSNYSKLASRSIQAGIVVAGLAIAGTGLVLDNNHRYIGDSYDAGIKVCHKIATHPVHKRSSKHMINYLVDAYRWDDFRQGTDETLEKILPKVGIDYSADSRIKDNVLFWGWAANEATKYADCMVKMNTGLDAPGEQGKKAKEIMNIVRRILMTGDPTN